jgi:hypothetical protein
MTINLNDLLSTVSPDALADMADIQANKKTGGKQAIPFDEGELAQVKGLVAACLVGKISQRAVTEKYKQMTAKSTDAATKQAIKDSWFPSIKAGRSASSFNKKFIEIYQELNALVEGNKNDEQVG